MRSNSNKLKYSKHVERIMKHKGPKKKINVNELLEETTIFCLWILGMFAFAAAIFL